MEEIGGASERLRVALGPRSYDIVIGSGMLSGVGGAVASLGASAKLALVTNPTVHALHGEAVAESLADAGFDLITVTVPDGEEYKSLEWTEHIWGELLRHRLDRKSMVVALGGGVIGDMAGFAASAYMRGIRFMQVPTTLLAQVDSSVGGKTGINHPLGKNMIGAFWQPSLVWVDLETLRTLPEREFLAGMAEVIKYGVIWDEGFFASLAKDLRAILDLEPRALAKIVRRSCEIKAEVVERDEREEGLRAILNYGHTVGHAVETVTGYTRYLHGEAVAIGMYQEARLARELGIMPEEEGERVRAILELYSLPWEMPAGADASALLDAMAIDKKALEGSLRFTLPERVGMVRVNEPVERKRVENILA